MISFYFAEGKRIVKHLIVHTSVKVSSKATMSSTRNKAPSSLTEVVGAAVLLVALPEPLAAGTQCSEVSTSEVPGMP